MFKVDSAIHVMCLWNKLPVQYFARQSHLFFISGCNDCDNIRILEIKTLCLVYKNLTQFIS
jgi:hypothetical protein